MRSWVARDNRRHVALPDSTVSKSNQVNRDARVYATGRVAGFCLWLACVSAAQAQAPQNLEAYSVSVQQLKVASSVRGHLARAERYFRKADMEAARVEVDRALREDPTSTDAFTVRAFIDLAVKNPAGAIADGLHAIALDANNAQAFLALASAYNVTQNFESAEQTARKALAVTPSLWQARLELAKSLYGRQQLIAALHELDALQTDFADVHLVRGDVLMQMGRRQDAANEFAAFMTEAPRDPRCEQLRQIVSDVAQASGAVF